MDEFIEKLEADQKRLRDHLRGQVLRFQKIGEYLHRIQQSADRIFVIGEGQLDSLSRLVATEFLRSWPVVPVSLSGHFGEDFDGVTSADDPVRVPRSYPRKVRDLARHLNESDMILALIHDGQNSDMKKILKIAKKANVKVLAIGGVDAREDLRDYCHVFLPLPTRGIKTICEASFICARLIGRFARAAKLEQQIAENSDRDIEESQQKAKEAWNGLKKVGEQAAKQARKKLKDSSGIAPRKSRSKEGSGENRRKKKTGKHKRKKAEEAVKKRRAATASAEERDGSGERSRSSSKRQPVTQGSEKRHSGRQKKSKKKGTRRSRNVKKETQTSGKQSRVDAERSHSSDTTKSALSSKSGENSRSSNDRLSKVSSKIKSRNPHEDKIIVPDELESSDVNEITMSEIETIRPTGKRRTTPGPGVSGELIPPKWLEENESVQEPIGMGSSFKSSGVFGDLGLQSDDLMPRYIRDALDPNSIPMPSASFDPIRDVEEAKTARFVSNRFKVQECTLRFASGGFPDDTVQEHPLIQLDPQNVSFSLDGEDDAAATLSQGDELWLRIEVPAFLEPILARAAIVGFETLDNQDGLRFNLQFTDIENDHRRKIHIAAESLATTQ